MQRAPSQFFARLATCVCLISLTVYLGYFVQRSDFLAFFLACGLSFALYAWELFRLDKNLEEGRWLFGLGIVLRVLLLFSIPNLSDDFYRFLWDGRLAAQGVHPFAHPPVFFMENPGQLVGITPELFQKLNSPEYHTVYPPVCQAVFWLAAKLFPESISGGVFVLKLFLFACELGTLAVLAKFGEKKVFPPVCVNPTPDPSPEGEGRRSENVIEVYDGVSVASPLPFGGGGGVDAHGRLPENSPCHDNLLVVAYALNPLILLEIVGNCHFEGAMLCFLLAGVAALSRGHIGWAALFWALATASKLLPLLFLPIVWAHLGGRTGLRFMALFSVFCAALFLPLLNLEVLTNMAGSLNLYFRQFAFNASGYYLLRAVGKALAPPTVDVSRTLGPILGLTVLVGVLVLAFWRRKLAGLAPTQVFHQKLLLASTLYLALATTVHPWYIALPFGLGLLTSWRFPLVWTGAAFLSYSHYAGGGFQENYGLIAMEYGLVLWAVWQDGTRMAPIGHGLN